MNGIAVGHGNKTTLTNGAHFYIGDWMVRTPNTVSAWRPAVGEPFYTHEMQWAVTGTGTYQSLSLAPGDVLTARTSPLVWAVESQAEWEKDLSPTYQIPYVDESLKTSNDDDNITNYVALASRGGSQYIFEDATSRNRYGDRSYTRGEMWWTAASASAAASYAANRILARSNVYRPASCQLHAHHGPASMAFMAGVDVGDVVDVYHPNVKFYESSIARIHHRLSPIPGSVIWTADIDLATTPTYSWEPS